jgi:DNA-binding Lrp family transcriptional regulator
MITNSEKIEIDDVDLKILQALMRNARTDFKDIASVVGVSDRTVARRIERLEKCGVIRGYYVDLNHNLLLQSGINLSEQDEYVRLSRAEWEELWNALGKVMGVGLSVLLFHAGKAVGLELGSKVLRKSSDPSEALKSLPVVLEAKGGRGCRFEQVDLNSYVGKLVVEDYSLPSAGKPVDICLEWLRGIVSGYVEAISGKVVEVKGYRQANGSIELSFN